MAQLLVDHSEPLCFCLHSKASVINMNVLLQLYILSVVKQYVYYVLVQSVTLLLHFFSPFHFCFAFDILLTFKFQHEGPVNRSKKKNKLILEILLDSIITVKRKDRKTTHW